MRIYEYNKIMKGRHSCVGYNKMKVYNISKTTIFIRKDLAVRKNDNDIIDDFDFDGNDSNKMFISKEKAIAYYNDLKKNLAIETKKLRSGFFYYKLSRITLDELEFEETEINESNINESNINDYSRFIFENMTDIICIDEFRHTRKDLENYRKGLN